MAKIQSGDVIDLVFSSKAEAKVGDFKWSILTEEAFEEEHLGDWMLCNGQSCVGTLYETLTGNTEVPNALTEGTFIRQAKSGRSLGSYEADDNKSHKHEGVASHTSHVDPFGRSSVIHNGTRYNGTNGDKQPRTYTSTEGGSEARPKNIALNLYVKVGY